MVLYRVNIYDFFLQYIDFLETHLGDKQLMTMTQRGNHQQNLAGVSNILRLLISKREAVDLLQHSPNCDQDGYFRTRKVNS